MGLRREDNDVIVTSQSINDANTLTATNASTTAKLRKHIASVTCYRAVPQQSESRRSAILMTSSTKDINLMIFPLSSIIIFSVLLAIRISRWCVEDVRDADESLANHYVHGLRDVIIASSRHNERFRRTSNDYVEASYLTSCVLPSSRPSGKSSKSIQVASSVRLNDSLRTMKSNSNAIQSARTATGNSRTRAAAGESSRRHHLSSRASKTRAHTADGRRRDVMSTTSIPLAELLSTTAAPLLQEGRDLLATADDTRLLRQAGTSDNIVDRCRFTGGPLVVFPVSAAAAVASVAHRNRKRTYSSPTSSPSASFNGSAATTSSWCSDSHPLAVRLGTSRSTTSASMNAEDQLVTSSNSTIDVSTPDLMTSSSPQLVRGCSGRNISKIDTAIGGKTVTAAAAASDRSRQNSAIHSMKRRHRQPPNTAPPVFLSKLARDSMTLNLRLFHLPLGGAKCSLALDSSDNLLRNSADCLFVCNGSSTENDQISNVAPPGGQLDKRISSIEKLTVECYDACSTGGLEANCGLQTDEREVQCLSSHGDNLLQNDYAVHTDSNSVEIQRVADNTSAVRNDDCD